MSGLYTDGIGQVALNTGIEQFAVDTELTGGQQPLSGMMTLQQMATAILYLNSQGNKTLVAGSRYYTSANIGFTTTLTGISVLVGATGGTDKFLVELHDSTGVLVATSATAGVTVGTAAQWQQIPFTATYQAAPGVYFLTVQTNGTTATLATVNPPTSPKLTGSATGAFGTGAAITAPTTYTANLGPIAQLY